MKETVQNHFNEIKQQFMLMKNGVVSDSMKAVGLPHRIIWGLNMPQLREIAERYDRSKELFDALWCDVATRESVVLAPMLLPYDAISADEVIRHSGGVGLSDVQCLAASPRRMGYNRRDGGS